MGLFAELAGLALGAVRFGRRTLAAFAALAAFAVALRAIAAGAAFVGFVGFDDGGAVRSAVGEGPGAIFVGDVLHAEGLAVQGVAELEVLAVRRRGEVFDEGPTQGRLRVGGAFAAHVAGGRLRVDLAADFGDFAVEAAVDVRVDLLRVVVVAEGLGLVAAELVELARGGAVGLVVSEDRVTIQRHGDGLTLAERLLEEDRCVVVVVVVALAAVAAEVVELAELLGVVAAVVQRVEDRDAVGRERDGAAHEVRLGGHRFLGRHGVERDLPGLVAGVGLRDRHLLLPGLDAGHERVVGQALGFDVEVLLVPAHADLRGEGLERSGEGWGRAGGGAGGQGREVQVQLGRRGDQRRGGGLAILRVDRRDVRVERGDGVGGGEQGQQADGGTHSHDYR